MQRYRGVRVSASEGGLLRSPTICSTRQKADGVSSHTRDEDKDGKGGGEPRLQHGGALREGEYQNSILGRPLDKRSATEAPIKGPWERRHTSVVLIAGACTRCNVVRALPMAEAVLLQQTGGVSCDWRGDQSRRQACRNLRSGGPAITGGTKRVTAADDQSCIPTVHVPRMRCFAPWLAETCLAGYI